MMSNEKKSAEAASSRPKILLAQHYTQNLASSYSALKEYFNVEVDFRSFTEVSFLSLPQFRIHKPTIVAHTAFLFTSRVVLDGFFKLVKECSIFLPKTTKYFLATPALQNHLSKYVEVYKRKTFLGQKNIEELLPIMYKHKREKFLFPCSDIGRQSISDFFKKKDYQYTALPIYQNVCCDLQDLVPNEYDIIVFFSPFAVESFIKNFPDHYFDKTRIAVYGHKTIEIAKEQGWPIAIAAPTPKIPSMVIGLIEFFDKILSAEANKLKNSTVVTV